VESEFPLLDWPSILVIFGYSFLLLFNIIKINKGENSFHNEMTKWISEIRGKVSCAPSKKLNIPFAYGSVGSQGLHKTAITFLMKNFNFGIHRFLVCVIISYECQYFILAGRYANDYPYER
jgi:hypothetical protein